MKFIRVVRPRAPSDAVSQRTLRRQSDEICSIRTLISKECPTTQLKDEIKKQPKEEREQLIKSISTVEIMPKNILAMKADLGIPWHKLRTMRRSVS